MREYFFSAIYLLKYQNSYTNMNILMLVEMRNGLGKIEKVNFS